MSRWIFGSVFAAALLMGSSSASPDERGTPKISFIRTTWTHEVANGKATDKRHRQTVEHCTADGRTWTEIHYRRNGEISRSYKTLRIDKRGNIVEQKMFYDHYEKEQLLKFRYEDRGFYTFKSLASKPDAVETSAVLKFDAAGNLVLQVWKNKYMTSVYSAAGKLTEVTTHSSDGRVRRSHYQYDRNGWLTTVTRTDNRQPEKTIKTYKRDAAGREIEMVRTGVRGRLIEKRSFTYSAP